MRTAKRPTGLRVVVQSCGALAPAVRYIAQLHLNRPALIAHRLVERQLQLARQELLALRQRLAELQTEEEEVRRQEEDLGWR